MSDIIEIIGSGLTGPQGPRGLQGLVGPDGPVGPKGDTGVAGTNGAAGAQGIQGIQGPRGLQGLKGDSITGPQGEQGLAGAVGPRGLEGPIGPNGVSNTLSIGSVGIGVASAAIAGTSPNQTLNLVLPQASLISSAKTTLIGNGVLNTFTVAGLKSSDPNHVVVCINGVTQEPTIDYLVNQGAGTVTFSTPVPNGAKAVVIALGLYSPSTQRDPDNFIHAFAVNSSGTFSYYGVMLNYFIPSAPAIPYTISSSADVNKWEITRSTLTSAGAVTSTAKASNVAWTNRETSTYA